MNRTLTRIALLILSLSLVAFTQTASKEGGKKAGSKPASMAKSKSGGGHEATQQNIEKMETSLWEAWKTHDAKPFEALLTDDTVNVVNGIERGKETAVKGITSQDCTVNSYSLSDFQYTWIDADAVIVTYVANQDATCGGKKNPEKVNASSVWAKKGGKWLSPFHQETPVTQ